MTDSLYTGGTTSQGPVVSANSAPSVSSNEFNYGIQLPQYNNIPCSNGVFSGTLSAQGNMIAMMFNPGGPKLIPIGTPGPEGQDYAQVPWLTGYAREYWKDPSQCTFGSNTAIPALTAVMPSSALVQGCLPYYVDLQLTRLSGSNYFDNFAFISTFNQVLNWVVSSNDYLLALQKAENNNLSYYGDKTYIEFTTMGFSNYKIGQALIAAISNVGKYITQISTGYFGTPNSIAKFLIDSGLGAYGSLTAQLISEDIPLDNNIFDEIYTERISAILKTVNNSNDLLVIQTVIGSTIPNMKNPLDYVSIETASGGLANDSVFKTFAEFGKDLYQRAPNFSLTTGKTLATIINLVLAEAEAGIEPLATTDSILPQDIINGLRTYLPFNVNNSPVSVLNIIGTPSGYLTGQLKAVNEGIDQLDKSKFGTQIRQSFQNLNSAYTTYKNSFSSTDPEAPAIANPAAVAALEAAKNSYYALVNTIANDPTVSSVVKKINSNYDELAQALSVEVINFNKANLSPSKYYDNTLISNFVSSLPSYAADGSGLGTDYFLYGLCQDNDAGNIVKSILNQYKNNAVLNKAGVRITNIL